MKLMIVGSGYVGLVAGACLSELGHEIVCVDREATKIAGLRAGVLPIFEPGLKELVLRNAAAGRLTFASDLAQLNNGVEAVFIAVGTPPSSIDQSADLSSVFAVARDVARITTLTSQLLERGSKYAYPICEVCAKACQELAKAAAIAALSPP